VPKAAWMTVKMMMIDHWLLDRPTFCAIWNSG
jgi:hypothetical protein